MIFNGRIPLADKERAAVDELLKKRDVRASVTRRDPGESGPLIVHVDDDVYVVAKNGKTTKVEG